MAGICALPASVGPLALRQEEGNRPFLPVLVGKQPERRPDVCCAARPFGPGRPLP